MAEQKSLLNKISKEEINTQLDFDRYLDRLSDRERCAFMTGLDLDLCTDTKFKCRFRGEDEYSLMSGKRKECRRPRELRMKKILGK